ncbi:winged helix-turn-helix transcriptional regulator [Paracoccus nototheniae]|uniref:Lrp/AsnC family transcriptional regulator n=1 Tax=Paracoccus nototheniae TaxID=2489002 RepID=UPI001039DD2A|nr:winged helix-turn-helix transcriptional regulator [Paracoccus nototheniae]
MVRPKLDRIDMNILVVLQERGRISNAELADAVGLSPSPCLLRVKRLQKAGYVTGYAAQLDLARLGPVLTIFLEITLTEHRAANFQLFEAAIRKRPEIVECHLVSGGFDYLVKVVVAELPHYQDMMEALQQANIGLAKYFSYIVVKTPVAPRAAPLKLLFEDDSDAR